jgi:DNA-binding LacI/PurR family transcriptional regulator
MAINIHTVAKKAHVSISTVSRVLNKSGYVSTSTQKKVYKAVEDLGYRQNKLAISLRKKTSSFIGLIVPDISNEFYSLLAKYIDGVIQRDGYSLFLGNSSWDKKKEKHNIELLLDNQVSGIVLAACGLDVPQSLILSHIPKIIIDNEKAKKEKSNVLYIESDNYKGAKNAVEILLQNGAEKIVYLSGYMPAHPMMQRKRGFVETMKEHGIHINRYRIYDIMISPQESSKIIKDIIREFPFDGLFCCTDTIALGAIHGLLEQGFNIPDDVQVIGFDGISLGEFIYPPLSTIRQDIENFGETIGRNILKMLYNKPSQAHIVLPTTFIKRGTTI